MFNFEEEPSVERLPKLMSVWGVRLRFGGLIAPVFLKNTQRSNLLQVLHRIDWNDIWTSLWHNVFKTLILKWMLLTGADQVCTFTPPLVEATRHPASGLNKLSQGKINKQTNKFSSYLLFSSGEMWAAPMVPTLFHHLLPSGRGHCTDHINNDFNDFKHHFVFIVWSAVARL